MHFRNLTIETEISKLRAEQRKLSTQAEKKTQFECIQ